MEEHLDFSVAPISFHEYFIDSGINHEVGKAVSVSPELCLSETPASFPISLPLSVSGVTCSWNYFVLSPLHVLVPSVSPCPASVTYTRVHTLHSPSPLLTHS